MDKSQTFREKYPQFIYESFTYELRNNDLVISYIFKIPPDIEFKPGLKIENINKNHFETIDKSVLNNFVFHLGLVEMISYWKCTCSPKIEIKAGNLNDNQIIWWKNLLIRGLGEMFYENNINFKSENFVEIKNRGSQSRVFDQADHKNNYLILNGGGRDSVVSIESIKAISERESILMLNPTIASLSVAEKSGIKSIIIARREIDQNLLELNSAGYINGHTPFSAYLAFLSALCAFIFDYKFTVASNEKSSNEENIKFLGEDINHQYSKSFEFEKLFREYLRENLSTTLEYFSLLRPLYELQISRTFSKYKEYFNSFKSCNIGQKNNTWCGKCPKCLSIYISLYPFLEKENINTIFGKDLFQDASLQDLLEHLIGLQPPKPFECVGTYDEMIVGLNLCIKKTIDDGSELPPLLKIIKGKINTENDLKKTDVILDNWDDNNFLEKSLVHQLKKK